MRGHNSEKKPTQPTPLKNVQHAALCVFSSCSVEEEARNKKQLTMVSKDMVKSMQKKITLQNGAQGILVSASG